MIVPLICFVALQTQIPSAEEFFPVVPGTVRTYEQKGGAGSELTNTVGQPLDMGGVSIIPITENGKTTYYRVNKEGVTIVAYDVKKPMPTPLPVLKIGNGKVTWDFDGTTATGAGGERLRSHGESHLGGQKTILGKKVDILTVRLAAAIGAGMSGYTIDQTAIYGRGLGLVELTTKMKLGKRTVETSYHIVSIEAAK